MKTATKRQCDAGNAASHAPRGRGYTLAEILIVIAIIVLLLALAVPAFRFITGSRSIGAAENIAMAMINRARAIAVDEGRATGVVFFLDPATGRTNMAIVVQKAIDVPGGEDPYRNYKGWSEFTLTGALNGQPSTTNTEYKVGHEVICSVRVGDKFYTRSYVCIQDHTASAANRPPNPTYWQEITDLYIDFEANGDLQVLPPGVGLQLINDPKTNNADRYVRTGAIFFNSEGRFMSTRFDVRGGSALGNMMGVPTGASTIVRTGFATYSQLGLILYEQNAFTSQGFTEGDFVIVNLDPSFNSPTSYAGAEFDEEQWLDNNSVPRPLNRYSGTLLKAD